MFKLFSLHKGKHTNNSTMEYDIMKYKLANDALGIALWDMDVVSSDPINPDNKFLWSPEFREMLGFDDAREFPNVLNSWIDRLHPEDKEATLAAFAAHINDRTGQTPFDIEYRLMMKSGEYRYFQALGTTLRDSEGVPLRVAGALRDINDRKNTQIQLMIMSSIVQNSPNFASYVKIGGTCLYVNPAASLMSGFSQEELMGDYLGCLFDDETRASLVAKVDKDLLDHGISTYETRWRTKDGEIRLMSGTSFMIEEDNFASIATDITGIKKIEDERAEALTTMKSVLDEVDAIIYVTEPATGEILYMNNSMRKRYGFTDDNAVGHLCYKVLQVGMDEKCDFCPCIQLDKDPDTAIVWERVDPFTGRIYRNTDRYIKWPDGNTVHLQHAVDITDLTTANELNMHMAEELKAALLETQEANHAKDEFLSRMSHEMLTPMNAITGMTQIIKMRGIPEKLTEAHAEIEKASHHLLRLINDLLDITGRRDGSFQLVESTFSFHEMFRGVMIELGPAIVEKQQTLSHDIDGAIPDTLYGDERRFAQVISHVLSNANKFTPEHGEIKFSADLVAENDGVVTLQIAIKDNGPGISKELQGEIFNLFEQADGSLTRKQGGVGLGLPLSEHIVGMMGGKIWVDSALGEGATFTFTCLVKRG